MDVTIFAGAGAGTFTWHVEGGVAQLLDLWKQGLVPVHLSPRWRTKPDAPGAVSKGGDAVPDVAIVLENQGVATLYIGDDAYTWKASPPEEEEEEEDSEDLQDDDLDE